MAPGAPLNPQNQLVAGAGFPGGDDPNLRAAALVAQKTTEHDLFRKPFPLPLGMGWGLAQRNTRPTGTAPTLAQLSSNACCPFRQKSSQTRTEPPSCPPGHSTPPPAWGTRGFVVVLSLVQSVFLLTPLAGNFTRCWCGPEALLLAAFPIPRVQVRAGGAWVHGTGARWPPGLRPTRGVTTRALPLPRASPTAAAALSHVQLLSARLTSKASPLKMCCS